MKYRRNILLLEPNYNNKYPPLGIMKIATYYRMLGDNVTFFKGDLKTFVIREIVNKAISKLTKIDSSVVWKYSFCDIEEYISKKNDIDLLNKISSRSEHYYKLIESSLIYFKSYYNKKKYFEEPSWDRIHIATLFTFYWKQTIETINFAKKIVKNIKDIYVGGVLASVVPGEVEKETGIKPIVGLLNKPGVFDDNDIIIDELELDYSVLEEIDYQYPENGSYYGYMTRGCVNRCPFCAVPILEPKYNKMISIKDKIEKIRLKFGEQKNLLLLDNNVVASSKFNDIIDEISEIGFAKGAKFTYPNYLKIAIDRIKEGYNVNAYIKKSVRLLNDFLNEKLHDEEKQKFYDLLKTHYLLNPYTATKENVLKVYGIVSDLYEQKRTKSVINRYVDFNQGLDARLLTEEKVEKISKLAIKPMRIAFDSWKTRKFYEKAVRLSIKHNIKSLSNYLLYNFDDEPVDLYRRLKLNVIISDTNDVSIYSFPMKYHPIMNVDYFKNREYIGKHWNRKFIRAIQAVLNSTKGKVGPGKSFFYKAFGKTQEEFMKILYMPEAFIIYRLYFENLGYTENWWKDYSALTSNERKIANSIIEANNFDNIDKYNNNKNIYKVLKYYTIRRDFVESKVS